MSKKKIAIFGTSKAKSGDGVFELAYELGKGVAEAGFDMINGGYGGIMLASARAANLAGGEVIGVTCDAFGRDGGNEYLTGSINTSCLDERLATLIDNADGYVVLPGSTGTLLELAKIWELKNKGFFKKAKPIIIVGGFWQKLVDTMAGIDADSEAMVTVVDTAEQAVACLVKELK